MRPEHETEARLEKDSLLAKAKGPPPWTLKRFEIEWARFQERVKGWKPTAAKVPVDDHRQIQVTMAQTENQDVLIGWVPSAQSDIF